MVFVNNIQTIGTAGRDFATHTLWEAALPANLTTGDGRNEIGRSHADSVYDELFVINGQTISTIENVYLVAAQGERPVIRPDGLGGGPTINVGTKQAVVDGLTIDGTDGLSTLQGFVIGAGQEGGLGVIARCVAKNLSGEAGFASVAAGARFAYCLSHDNERGFKLAETSSGGSLLCVNCGAYKNDDEGFVGFGGTNPDITLRNCWAFENAVANYQNEGGGASNGDGCWGDDGTTSILSGARLNNEITTGEVAALFKNLAGRDFDLSATSGMRAVGMVTWPDKAFSVGIDLGGRSILNTYASIKDIGPFQPSLAVTAESLGGGKLIIGVI